MKNLLLCGANGFIGKNILERLSKNKNFHITATYLKSEPGEEKDNVTWVNADLRDYKDVNRVVDGIDIILQYAATTTGAKDIVSKPYIHVTDNAIMNSLLMRAAFEKNVKHFVMPSCTIMYQDSSSPLSESDFNENDEIFFKYYGAGNTKIYLGKMCKFYSNIGNTKYTVLRQSNIYGPHDKYDLEKSHVFGATITKVMTAKEKITVWGKGKEERDFLHVHDLLDLIDLSIKNQVKPYVLINASYGKSVSIEKLVKTVIKESGKNLKIEYDVTKPNINTKIAISNQLAHDIFRWSPKYSLKEGVKNTLAWYDLNQN